MFYFYFCIYLDLHFNFRRNHFYNFRMKIRIVGVKKSSLGFHHCTTKTLRPKNPGWSWPNEGMICRKVLSKLKKNSGKKNGFRFFPGATNGLNNPVPVVLAGLVRQQNVCFRVCSKNLTSFALDCFLKSILLITLSWNNFIIIFKVIWSTNFLFLTNVRRSKIYPSAAFSTGTDLIPL